jgi:hypothetical protein
VNRLLAEMMDLHGKGAIKPIAPVTVFPFEDIVSAFVYLRGGNHLGKVVISNGTTANVKVPVSLTLSLNILALIDIGASRNKRSCLER